MRTALIIFLCLKGQEVLNFNVKAAILEFILEFLLKGY